MSRAMASYDETTLVQAADDLLRQAGDIMWRLATEWGIKAGMATLIATGAFQAFAPKTADVPIALVSGAVALVAAAIGYYEGHNRSFNLRLEAHKLLALIEIERNTRKAVS